MKRLLFMIVLIAATVGAFGHYRGWFHLGSDIATDKTDITFTVDKTKIEADKDRALGTVRDLGHEAKDGAAAATRSTQQRDAVAPGAR